MNVGALKININSNNTFFLFETFIIVFFMISRLVIQTKLNTSY